MYFYTASFASVSACLRTVREAGPYEMDGRLYKKRYIGVALKSSENYAQSPKGSAHCRRGRCPHRPVSIFNVQMNVSGRCGHRPLRDRR